MSLNVIGLISGGKDSLYSLAHCAQNGHKIVALANLYPTDARYSPTEKENEDLNSFMYQTVGYSAIPAYAEALELPLYRRAISGIALQKGKDYAVSRTEDIQNDETEDMYFLLKDILERHPEANALNAGAILSTYQRTRVESVATRLGLVPLAYLWQYPALPPPALRRDSLTGLLEDMSIAGCDARIIKLASGGIRSTMLFANVANPTCASQLLAGLSRFYVNPGQEFELRGAVLGEGGEYETLALDGPSVLWKRRIAIDLVESSEVDGIAYAHFTMPRIVARDHTSQNEIPIPEPFDERFKAVLERLDQSPVVPGETSGLSESPTAFVATQIFSHTSKIGNTLQLRNLTASGSTAAEQFVGILDSLLHSPVLRQTKNSLSYDGLFQDIVSTTLLLDDIDAFAEVNRIYSDKLWPANQAVPPARVTIAALLPPGVHIALSLLIDCSKATDSQIPSNRDGLHVQSRSYWAPANIGPYSQAVSAPLSFSSLPSQVVDSSSKVKLVHMAGQIPLYPPTMQLFEASFRKQATMALQHLWRVGQERKVDLWLGAGIAYLSTTPQHVENAMHSEAKTSFSRAREASAIWQLAHILDEKGKDYFPLNNADTSEDSDDEEKEIDVWHLQQNRGLVSQVTTGKHLHVLPNYRVFSSMSEVEPIENEFMVPQSCTNHCSYTPPFVAAEVAQLPRHASIEWWSTGIAGLTENDSNVRKSFIVHAFYRLISKGCLATGIILRYSESDDSERDEDKSSSPGRDTYTCFWTLLINLDAEQEHVTKIIADPTQALLQALPLKASPASYEAGASSSYLNLSAPQVIQDIIIKSGTVGKSTVVPCKHVWASDYKQEQRESGTFPDFREVSLAMLLRLDVR